VVDATTIPSLWNIQCAEVETVEVHDRPWDWTWSATRKVKRAAVRDSEVAHNTDPPVSKGIVLSADGRQW
jgi:hypothetical protein